MTKRRRLSSLAPPVLLVVALGACASDAPQDTLEPEGPIARQIDNLVNHVFIIAAVVFVLVEFGVLLVAAVGLIGAGIGAAVAGQREIHDEGEDKGQEPAPGEGALGPAHAVAIEVVAR